MPMVVVPQLEVVPSIELVEAGVMLGLVSASPEGKAMLRVMLVEMLGHADALMDRAPGGMGKLMGVILEDRNQVVVADLKTEEVVAIDDE